VRKVVVVEYMSLDGVIQAPGHPHEDPDGGFDHGGWRDSVIDVCGCIDPCTASQSSTLCRGRQAFWHLHRVHRHVPLADLMGSANVNYGVSAFLG